MGQWPHGTWMVSTYSHKSVPYNRLYCILLCCNMANKPQTLRRHVSYDITYHDLPCISYLQLPVKRETQALQFISGNTVQDSQVKQSGGIMWEICVWKYVEIYVGNEGCHLAHCCRGPATCSESSQGKKRTTRTRPDSTCFRRVNFKEEAIGLVVIMWSGVCETVSRDVHGTSSHVVLKSFYVTENCRIYVKFV